MTKAATVIRHNAELQTAYEKVCELAERTKECPLADTGSWANQEVVFARALEDMFPLAKTILLGALGAGRVPRVALQAGVRHARNRRHGPR